MVITDHQTDGRGTDTNSWESEKGKNLTFSLILYPAFGAEQQFILNKAISLGIYDFLKSILPTHKISIKWPNDLYIGDKKVCGILIQNSVMGNKLEYMVAGIGLNVNQIHFKSNAPNPVSLKIMTGQDYNLDELLQKLLKSILKRYTLITPETTNTIETEYHRALYQLMEWQGYLIKGNRLYSRITGTNAYGQLVLENERGEIIICDMKEVRFPV